MAFFDWKDEFSVKIKAIDTQHKKIIELMNELFESLRDGREELVIRDVLDELLKYAEYHFGLEAGLFKKYGYDKAAAHLAEHEVFVTKIACLSEALASNAEVTATETLDYLRDWFKDHMLTIDIDYGRFFESIHVIGEIEAQRS